MGRGKGYPWEAHGGKDVCARIMEIAGMDGSPPCVWVG